MLTDVVNSLKPRTSKRDQLSELLQSVAHQVPFVIDFYIAAGAVCDRNERLVYSLGVGGRWSL